MNYEEKLREIVNSNSEYYSSEDKAVFAKYFPELKSDDYDEGIKKGIIRNLQYLMDKSEGFVKKDLQEKIDWLKKQDSNKEYVFRPVAGTMIENAVEQALKQGDVVLAFNGFYTPVKGKTSDEILAEYDCWIDKQSENKPDFSNIRIWKYIVDMVLTERDGIGQYLDNTDTERIAKKLQEKYGNIEKQGEQPTDKIEQNPDWSEEDEEMLTWLCRIIHSQRLNKAITLKEESELGEWIDKWLNHNPNQNQSEHLENYDEYERIRKGLIKAVSRIFEGHKLFCTDVTREEALAWLEMQAESNPYSGVSFKYNGHIWGMCARDNGVEILFDGELKAFLSLEKSFIYPIYPKLYPKPDITPKSALEAAKEEKVDNQICIKPSEDVEPKFHPGDWIATEDSFGKIVRHIDEIRSNIIDKGYVASDENGLIYNISFSNEHKWHKWTIADAKDGDVLVDSYSKDSIIILYKGIYKERTILAHCGWNGYNLTVNTNGFGYGGLDNTNYLPATKEQRDLLFQKIKEADYAWDDENKKLSKQTLKITPKFCIGQLITDNNGNWYKITNIKCLDDWYYELYDVCENNTHHELCSIVDEKFRANSFVHEIKKMMGD